MDWMYECNGRRKFNSAHILLDSGNFLVISSTAACTIALTWGGITAPWHSVRVLVPLVLGLVGLWAFIVYEAALAKHPIVCILITCPPI